jgi:hypothetical protein
MDSGLRLRSAVADRKRIPEDKQVNSPLLNKN